MISHQQNKAHHKRVSLFVVTPTHPFAHTHTHAHTIQLKHIFQARSHECQHTENQINYGIICSHYSTESKKCTVTRPDIGFGTLIQSQRITTKMLI